MVGYNDGDITGSRAEGEVRASVKSSNFGGLVGYNMSDGIITDCHANVTVNSLGSTAAGGLAGENYGSIAGSYAVGAVEGGSSAGGLVGSNWGSIEKSYATGTVTGSVTSIHVGGLVGYSNNSISQSYATGNVSGKESLGGLTGRNDGSITDSYAMVTVSGVSGSKNIGGLVGYNLGSITNSYSTGAVSGSSDVGGLVGKGESYSTVTDSYWDKDTSNRAGSSGGTGKSTAEMKQWETYEEWDFSTIWNINDIDNNGYPFLRWQVLVATVPTAPQNFTAVPGDGQVTLSWTAPEDDGGAIISRYEVSGDDGVSWTGVGLNTSYTFTGLTNGTEYTFKVRAVNSIGPGEEAFTTATPIAAPVTTYTVTVTNGTGSGEYTQGVTVSISANSAPDGYQFKEWQVISGGVTLEDPEAPVTSFIMPANDVEIAAVYEEIPVTTYTVTVNGSYAATTGAGSYAQGDTVTIDAGSRANYSFSGWTSPDNVIFANPNSAATTFIMPAKNVTVTANWTYTGADYEDQGDDTGDSGMNSPTYSAIVKIEQGAEMTVSVTVDSDAGIASVDMDSDKFAQGRVNITIPSIPDVVAYSVSVPVQDLSTPNDQDEFSIDTEIGSITVPSSMLTGIKVPEGDKAQITIGRGDSSVLPKDVRDAIGDRPLVQLTLSIDGNRTEWNNLNAPVTVTIPYKPTEEELENPGSIVVWYIDGSGNAVCVTNGRYDPATGTVTFTTTHFSYYAVSYKLVNFNDVAKDAWFAEAVSFIAARDITQGMGGGNFSPDC